MRLLTVLFALVGFSAANQAVTSNVIETLLKKIKINQGTEHDFSAFKNLLELHDRPEHISKSMERNQPGVSIECLVCRSAFAALFEGVRQHAQTDEEAKDALVALCIGLNIVKPAVCQGAVGLNIPIIAHIIRTEPQASAAAFCGLQMQTADNPNACPFNDPRFEWQVQLPAKSPNTPVPLANNPKPLKVALITDAHIDPLYEAFGVADCGAPVCCRKGQTPRSSLSNINETNLTATISRKQKKRSLDAQSLSAAEPAGYWGDYRNCDTPIWAFEDAIDNIYENNKDVDLVYYVGDTIDHGIWETSYELINDMNRLVVEKIRKTFGEHVIVVPALGNHESQPTNQFAPSTIVGEKLNTTWLYKGLVEKWGTYLTDEAKQNLLERGDFSLLVRPGLRVISLNNNVAYRDNWWLVYDPTDSKKHLDWLVRELHSAELAGERVHILAHIPPGVHDLTFTWTREYNRIVNRFSATIAAEFNGHTHADEFKIFYSPEGTPINVAWGAGSITAFTFYNLNYKIVNLDATTFVPTSISTYAYNLTEANLTPNRRPHWFLLYDMANSYGLTDLSAQSMHNLVRSMVTNNRRLLDLFTAFHSRISDVRWPDCRHNAHCQINNLCRTVITVLGERQRCNELINLFFA